MGAMTIATPTINAEEEVVVLQAQAVMATQPD
jgi:hypothetical protein